MQVESYMNHGDRCIGNKKINKIVIKKELFGIRKKGEWVVVHYP